MPEKLFVLGIDASGRTGIEGLALHEMIGSCVAMVGSSRQIELLASHIPDVDLPASLNWNLGVDALIEATTAAKGNILILASGDPGYFGIVRLLRVTLPGKELMIYPVPSSVSLAFAKVGVNWEDAVVISAHGRPYSSVLVELMRALEAGEQTTKLAVLCSPEHTPQFIAQVLLDAHARFDRYLVCSDLGSTTEFVFEGTLQAISQASFSANSVLVAVTTSPRTTPSVSNLVDRGFSDPEFVHRKNMITKREVREVIAAKLLPYLSSQQSCLWDLGAGSGSVGISIARQLPSIQLILVDNDPLAVRLLTLNSDSLSNASIIKGKSQEVMKDLPAPTAVFIGGGGIEVLAALKDHLNQQTFVAASYASMNRATEAADLLGNLIQINLPVGKRLKDGSWRLEGENPVFLSWGLLS